MQKNLDNLEFMQEAVQKKKDTQNPKTEGNTAAKPAAKKKLMFVCTGNTCRSPVAEYLLRYLLSMTPYKDMVKISSSGLHAEPGAKMSDFARQVLKKNYSIDASRFKAKRFVPSMLKKNALIITMTKAHKKAIGNYFNVFTLGELSDGRDVPDPFLGDYECYERMAETIMRMLIEFINCVMT